MSDKGEPLGIERDYETLGHRQNADGWEQHLRNVLNAYLGKEIAAMVELSFADYQGKTVAVLRAEPSTKPVFLVDGANTEFHVRSGNTTQMLDVKETQEYIAMHFPKPA